MNTAVFAIVCLALIIGGFVAGILFSINAFQPSASSSLPEYLLLSEPEYGGGTSGWLAMTVNNTGIGNVILVKVLIDNIKQSLVNPVLPVTVALARARERYTPESMMKKRWKATALFR